MAIDVLTERGYHVTADQKFWREPSKIDLSTGIIHHNSVALHIFYVRFSKTELRFETTGDF